MNAPVGRHGVLRCRANKGLTPSDGVCAIVAVQNTAISASERLPSAPSVISTTDRDDRFGG